MTRILFIAFLFFRGKVTGTGNRESDCDGEYCVTPSSPPVGPSLLSETRRWPDKTIRYEIDKITFPEDETHSTQGHSLYDNCYGFQHAMLHIEGRTCIRFRWTSEEYFGPGGVRIFASEGNGSCSDIGMNGGVQNLYVGKHPHCKPVGTLLHQLLHIIGFDHEEKRPDRDEFVTINWSNINEENKTLFRKRSENCTSLFGVPYDYKSVMHSRKNASSKNGKTTIVSLHPDIVIGATQVLSNYDIKKINEMYCPGTQTVRFENVKEFGKFLTMKNYTHQDRQLYVTNFLGRGPRIQEFTVDWYNLRRNDTGSLIYPWFQTQPQSISVVTAHPPNRIIHARIYFNYGRPSIDLWYVRRAQNWNPPYRKSWQLLNRETHKCAGIQKMNGSSIVVQANCYELDESQLWNIYNV